MGEYNLWKMPGDNYEMYRFRNRYYPEAIRPNPYSKDQKEWFFEEVHNQTKDFIYESWGSIENVDRLDQFYENYKNGIADRILIQQDGNPAYEQFEVIYPGNGTTYTVQGFLWMTGGIQVMGNISLIENYYYFTQGDIQVKNSIITYKKDGEVIQVEFDTFPVAEGQPMKIGREGSGWIHP